jgi:ABC-type antimicrobial peptide transport system permease subunit
MLVEYLQPTPSSYFWPLLLSFTSGAGAAIIGGITAGVAAAIAAYAVDRILRG